MTVCAVIVAGGRSSRMGRDKALELVRGRSILDRVASALGAQVTSVVLNANGDPDRFRDHHLPVIADFMSDIATPLAGLHAAMRHAGENGFTAVLTSPCDTPFLPLDLLRRLSMAGQPAAIAASAGQPHFLTGLWSCELLPRLEQVLTRPSLPRLQDWCRTCNAAVVAWPVRPYDPFFNVNTPEELAEAERIAAEFSL